LGQLLDVLIELANYNYFSTKYRELQEWAAAHGIAEDGWGEAAAAGLVQVAKPGKAEKEEGCEELPLGPPPGSKRSVAAEGCQNPLGEPRKCAHPTVKPVRLMSYLCHLACPPGGLVLDPFAGSGTTGVAAVKGGWDFLGMELSPEYVAIAEARIGAVKQAAQPSLAMA
jgi:site-specific DNA-methyltransferase (adenine-specific)